MYIRNTGILKYSIEREKLSHRVTYIENIQRIPTNGKREITKDRKTKDKYFNSHFTKI